MSKAQAYPSVVISKAKAAMESAVRTFVQTFLGSFAPALVAVNWATTDWSGAKTALVAAGVSAGGAALAAAVAAAMRVFSPLTTDKPGAYVA